MDTLTSSMLNEIAGIADVPTDGAYNIRVDGKSVGRASTQAIEITPREDGGLNIRIAPGTKNQHVHIPVVIKNSGHQEKVINEFFIGEGADIIIRAGCAIHNPGQARSQHDGLHTFHVGKNAKVVYEETHLGEGEGDGERIMNPITVVDIDEGGYLEMNTVQIRGVDSTRRETNAVLGKDATLVIKEKLMTHGRQFAETTFNVDMNGENCTANVASRSVARDASKQVFLSKINGNAACVGHSECDAIIMDEAVVQAIPEVTANNVEASLIHEAAIGKIAGDQIIKLMTLGLSREEAEQEIVNGFMK